MTDIIPFNIPLITGGELANLKILFIKNSLIMTFTQKMQFLA